MKISKSKLQELRRREKRMVAFHEASHAALLHHFGGVGVAEIWPSKSRDLMDKAWCGQCKMYARPGEVTMTDDVRALSGVAPVPAPDNWAILVGMAGYVGERIAAGDFDAALLFDELNEALRAGEISATDLGLIGATFGESDMQTTLSLLVSLWPKVEASAEYLIAYR